LKGGSLQSVFVPDAVWRNEFENIWQVY